MRPRYFTAICCLLLIPLFAYTEESVLKERVYLQTDKQQYLAGELVWIKLITTDKNGTPIDFSKVGYVELINADGPSVQIAMEIKNSVGEGWMELPATLQTGNYKIVAYTRYMQNEGEEVFFSKIIPILNTFTVDNTISLVSDSTSIRSSASYIEPSNGPLKVSTDKATYSSRVTGTIYLNELPNNIQTLAVSIAGIELYDSDQADGIQRWKANLGSLKTAAFTGKWTSEYEGHILTGKIIDILTGKPSAESQITPLLSYPSNQLRFYIGKQEGEMVTYTTKRASGMHEIATTALSYNTNHYRIDLESPYCKQLANQVPPLSFNVAWNDMLLKRSVGLQVLNAYMADSLSQLEHTDALFQVSPTRTYILDEYTRFETLGETVTEFITPLRFRVINGKRHLLIAVADGTLVFTAGNALVLLDGVPIIDHDIIYSYDPSLLKEINVYMGSYVFGGYMFGGIASFKTYNNDYIKLSADNATQVFKYNGIQARRHFYIPSYQTEKEKASTVPDFRHTLLWNPDIAIQGKSSVTVPFTTSDLTGDFVVSVEGLTKDGKPIAAKALIKVE